MYTCAGIVHIRFEVLVLYQAAVGGSQTADFFGHSPLCDDQNCTFEQRSGKHQSCRTTGIQGSHEGHNSGSALLLHCSVYAQAHSATHPEALQALSAFVNPCTRLPACSWCSGSSREGQLLQLVLLCHQLGVFPGGHHPSVCARERELDHRICHPCCCHAAGCCHLCGWQLQICTRRAH